MRRPLDFRLVDLTLEVAAEPDLALAAEPAALPGVLTRVVTAPPGWPWEQRRAAVLEARHGAPLPIEQMHLRLKRLAPWRPSQPARFAAIYVRAAEVAERFETMVEVDGQAVGVAFDPPEALARRARQALVAGVAAAAVAALLFVSIAGALLARSENEARLAMLERQASVKLRAAEAVQAARRDATALALVEPGQSVAVPLSDLAWAMNTRAPDARIEAWRWSHGEVEVEARGSTPPFVDPRRVQIQAGAVTQGVWRWRIEPEGGR